MPLSKGVKNLLVYGGAVLYLASTVGLNVSQYETNRKWARKEFSKQIKLENVQNYLALSNYLTKLEGSRNNILQVIPFGPLWAFPERPNLETTAKDTTIN